jgi:hypothetical protein
MFKKYYSLSTRVKVFVWLTVTLIIFIPAVYLLNVAGALQMDPNSYNCTTDSMMKQICQDPWGSSVAWTYIYVAFFGWPLMLAWLSSGIFVLIRRVKMKPKKEHPPATT